MATKKDLREAAKAFASMGGKARAKKLTKEQRVAIAKSGAKARWGKVNAKNTGKKT